MPPWRIYYGSGATFEGPDPEAAPPHGVVAIVQPDPHTRRNIMHGWDFYYWNDSEGPAAMWWGIDLPGLLQRHFMRLPVRALVQGITVDSALYRSIMKRADGDRDFIGLLKG